MRKTIAALAVISLALLAGCAAPRIAPAGDRPGQAEATSRYFITSDGLPLPHKSWRPEGEPAAVLLMLHGFNDYSGAFRETGPKLAAAGVLAHAYDQRGFGGAPNRGLWPGGDALRQDATDFARTLKARHPDLPLFILGLSMGGAVAMTALAETPDLAAGAVLIAPALRGRQSLPAWQRWSLDVATATIPWYPATGQGLNIRPTDNIAALRRMSRDPYVLKETRIDALHGLVELMTEAEAAAAHQTTPLLILYGLKDDLVPKGPTLDALTTLPETARDRPPHRLAVYDNGRHMLLRDLAADTAIADIVAWIADQRAPLPSGADADAKARLSAAAKD